MIERDKIICGDALDKLTTLDAKSVQCCVTSPPYWLCRTYDNDGQLGQEDTIEEFIDKLADVFDEVWRVLKDDGVLWVNLGDKYVDKDLLGMPWMFALEMKKRGWILRNDIIWHKPDSFPMPLKDRCASCHEHIFMFTKRKTYQYDVESIMEPLKHPNDVSTSGGIGGIKHSSRGENGAYSGKAYDATKLKGKIRRDVWTIATSRSKDSHFAVFPEKIPELCIKATTQMNDIVLDPFNGSGTTGVVAVKLGRKYIGIEINEEYASISRERLDQLSTLTDFFE